MIDIDFNLLINDLRVKNSALLTYLKRLENKEFPPSVGPKNLIGELQSVCYAFNNYLIDGIKTKAQELGVEYFIKELRILHGKYQILFELTEYVSGTTLEKAPYEIIRPFEMIVKELLGEPQEYILLIRSQSKYNFSFYDLFNELKKLSYPDYYNPQLHFPVISCPEYEIKNIFILGLLAHEIGHLYDYRHSISKKVLEDSKSEQEFKIMLNKLTESIIETEQLGMGPLFEEKYKAVLGKQINIKHTRWVKEITADIIGLKILGLSYLFSFDYLFKYFENDLLPKEYPPNTLRYKHLIMQLNEDIGKLSSLSSSVGTEKKRFLSSIEDSLNNIKNYSENIERNSKLDDQDLAIYNFLLKFTEKPIEKIKSEIFNNPKILPNYFYEDALNVALLLERDIIPCDFWPNVDFNESKRIPKIGTILNGAWFYWDWKRKQLTNDFDKYNDESEKINRLTFRAIELSDFHNHFLIDVNDKAQKINKTITDLIKSLPNNLRAEEEKKEQNKGGVLTREDIINRLLTKDSQETLVITPIFNGKQIGGASVDIRLGNGFFVIKKTQLAKIDVEKLQKKESFNYYEKIRLEWGKEFILHPGEFALGSSLEYIVVPNDLMCYVIGRSSWGRLGLIIATATQVAPGFKGVITLELCNQGTTPIYIRPGNLIAQLVFHKCVNPSKTAYKGPYSIKTDVEVSKFFLTKTETEI